MKFTRTKTAAHCVGSLSLMVADLPVRCVIWNVGSSLKSLNYEIPERLELEVCLSREDPSFLNPKANTSSGTF